MKKRSLVLLFIFICLISSQVVFANSDSVDTKLYERIKSHVNENYSTLSEFEKLELTDEIYLEKTDPKYYIEDSYIRSISNNNVDESYDIVMNEEKYIVSLINDLLDKNSSTSLDNWKFNLSFLKENYDEISDISDINLDYVNSYINAYEIVLLLEDEPNERLNFDSLESKSMYSSYLAHYAVEYASDYYRNYNPNYPDWGGYGGDCANFVSQCLHAGGKRMRGTPGSSSSAQDFRNWFSVGSTTNTSNVSSTWRGADAFRHYWQSNSTSYKKFNSFSLSAVDYGRVGDTVTLLNSNGRGYHTLIIIGFSSSDLIMAQHSSSRYDVRLSDKSNFIIYNMR